MWRIGDGRGSDGEQASDDGGGRKGVVVVRRGQEESAFGRPGDADPLCKIPGPGKREKEK